MRRMQYFLYVVLCTALTTTGVVSGFKEHDFKKCKDASFCNRLRGVVSANYSLDPTTVKLDKGVFYSSVTNEDDGVSFTITITAYEGVLRVSGDEQTSQHRIQVPDVLMASVNAANSKALQMKKLTGGVALSLDATTVDIHYKPFKLVVSTDGTQLFVLNEQQLFHIEHKREKQEGDPEGWWDESFKTHKDTKPKGPQAISFDLEFPGFEHLYGIPERATSFALCSTKGEGVTSEPYRLYNLDVFEYLHESPFGLYGSVPLLLAHKKGHTVGAFWLNAAEMYVDVSVGDQSSSTQWMAESGALDLFLLLGPKPSDVVSQYAWLTGSTAMPQMFAIAYHQCRWNYRDEEDVRNVDGGFDEHGIPYDVLWLDIEHTDGKRYMTWDKNYFPNPMEMQLDVASRGRRMVTIIDPHVKRDSAYYIFAEAEKQGYYVKTHDNKDFDGWCWPGSSSYLDVVNPTVRDWWAQMFSLDNYQGSTKHLYVWNDMNEPSVFNGPEITMHKDNIHYGGIEHRDIHNLYGFLYHMATADGLRQRGLKVNGADGDRPFVLSRAFFSGTQRVGPIWTGDNTADWEHLRVSIPMLLSIGMTGVTFSGADVGGFFGNPDAELMTRWYQLGAFYPFFRGHAHLETARREPWLFGDEATEHIRNAIQTRYALLPYLYTLFRHANLTGAPVMRPLWYEFPDLPYTFTTDDVFMLGPALLVAPVLHQGATNRTLTVPQGAVWYDAVTGEVLKSSWNEETSSQEATVAVQMDSVPLFLRGGHMVARKERPRRSTSAMKLDPITLYVALDQSGTAAGDLYLDDGESYAFQRGEYTHRRFAFADGVLRCAAFGTTGSDKYDPGILVERIVVLGLEGGPAGWSVSMGGAKLEAAAGQVTFAPTVPANALVVRKPNLSVSKDWALQFSK